MTITQDLFIDVSDHTKTVAFEPTRRAGLARLEEFAALTGSHYASKRNYDLGPSHRSTVSALSPWIRHRLITEDEVLKHTLAHHSATTAIKFIQEVFWRGYFKGWLQQHPSVWQDYQSGLHTAQIRVDNNVHRKADFISAIEGRTGIDCFDHWCRELKETGYLHNHARMWFASIWIFTLRLPWELGANFFLSYLIDGDPAANTLSWRWVGGLHTKGKTYLARSNNIAKYTLGAFDPNGQLALTAEPLIEEYDHPLVPFTPKQSPVDSDYLLLITPEDCQPEGFISGTPANVLGLTLPRDTRLSTQLHPFKKRAVEDAIKRFGAQHKVIESDDWTAAIITAAQQAGTTKVYTPFVPVGPVATKLALVKEALGSAGIELHLRHRPYDVATWPHATKGFFKLKKMIPSILTNLGHTNA